ncbi:MAG: starch-binding protein, partial [Candidatus Izemoplasmatales bacterium]|nr:starch-binding protein [Candidatus Izemoplasmatales bacterium]
GLFGAEEQKTGDIYIDNDTGLYVVRTGGVHQSKTEAITSRIHFLLPVWDPALSTPDIHIWGGTDLDNGWPGVTMTSEGDGWYYYDITTTTTNYNIIISAVQSEVRKQSVTIVVNQGQDIYVTMGSTWNGNEFSVNITEIKP